MPKLAAFPKAWMQGLCVDGSLPLERWIEMAGELDVDGLEFYSGFLDLRRALRVGAVPAPRRGPGAVASRCSAALPTSPTRTRSTGASRSRRRRAGSTWRRPWAAAPAGSSPASAAPSSRGKRAFATRPTASEECLPHAAAAGITLVIENHYKDDFWQYPEFAQKMDVFCDLVERIDSPHFGVNYDPSNTILAGEDPLELLRRVRHRVVTMHASDRYLAVGTLEDLRREESSVGYATPPAPRRDRQGA